MVGFGSLWTFSSGLYWQHRTIPALRLKHRSGSCGTASALPKCSIMSGCGTRIVLRGQKPSHSATAALLRFAVSATGGAHLCSIQYYLRFWLGICRTSLAVSALRIMRYCLLFLLHSPLFCSGNFSLHKKRLSIAAYIQILHLLRYKKRSFRLPFFRYFYTYMQFLQCFQAFSRSYFFHKAMQFRCME